MKPTPSPLVRSGLAELAAAALSGWVYTLARTQPEAARRLGIKSAPRIRQWHLDLVMMGTAKVACGAALEDPSPLAARALQVGGWTNAMAFLPLAFRPEIDESLAFKAAVGASFVTTTIGFCGVALSGRRAAAKPASRWLRGHR